MVVNNTDYSQIGRLTELRDQEARLNFDTNVFCCTCCVTPHQRQQGAGRAFNSWSAGGYTGNFPGWGIYCGTTASGLATH